MNDKDLLNNIKVASPCSVPWSSMTGDDRVRHCGQCQLSVYNLSTMPTKDAAELLRSAGQGRVCVQFFRRRDGTVMTDDCPTGLKKLRDRLRTAWIAACLFIAGIIVGPIAAQGLFGAPGITGGQVSMTPRVIRVIDESVRRNYLSTLVASVLFLKLGIPLLNRQRWWQTYWSVFSFFGAFMAGMLVDCACKIVWPGVKWSSVDPVLECLITGCLFGISCLLTAAIFRASQPISSHHSGTDRNPPIRTL